MDALSDGGIERVVLMKSAQTGGTECSLNAIGYYIDQDPSPMLIVQPTVEMGLKKRAYAAMNSSMTCTGTGRGYSSSPEVLSGRVIFTALVFSG